MIYKYQAKKGPDDLVESTIEALNEKEAIEKISALGYIPVYIQEQSVQVASAHAQAIPAASVKMRSRDITIFSRQLASLLKSGVPILSAINVILEQSDNEGFKAVLLNIHDSLKSGSQFSAVLSLYPRIFPPLYVALIRSGEDSGSLPDALLRIADYRIKQEEFASRLRMAFAYPVLMSLVGLGTIVFMLTFVMPRLMKIFMSLGQDLPMPTKIMIGISNQLSNLWVWVVLGVLILLIKRESKEAHAKIFLSRVQLFLPIFGPLTLKAELSCFSRTLELLIKSGIPILKAIDIAIPVANNAIIKARLKESLKELEQGGSFGQSLKKSKLFPLFMTNLIIVGEESGRLTEALGEVASSYERDTDEAVKIMTNLLEPLMILVMGLIVGFIVIAMLLPIFEINVMAR